MKTAYFIVDSFTDIPFRGNPAAVVLMEEKRSDEWMQSVAAEMNLSETAFVNMTTSKGSDLLSLRWFTPTNEVDFCGHATLAAAHVLDGTRRFSTNNGELTCIASNDGYIEMNFPADPTTTIESTALLTAPFQDVSVSSFAQGKWDVLVELSSDEEVVKFNPDFSAIAAIPVRGVIITAPSSRSEFDFISRCFYPNVGVPEDPVTGSAHCTLAYWWAKRLDKQDLMAHQASKRGGSLRISQRGDRTHIFGKAITIAKGELQA